MKSNAFGLDIGTTSIKMVYLSKENNLFEYTSSILAPTPPAGILSESPLDQQEMAQMLNKYVSDAKISVNNVNIALPENQVFTKVIDMPLLSEKELANAIYWEAEQYIPAQLDTMTLDWTILRNFEVPEPKMQVLLVAAQTQLVKRYQNILELAGLNLIAIETEILSVIRSAGQNANSSTILFIHIGAMSTSLAIVQRGIIVFNYVIPLGGIALTRAIASDFGFSPTQSEEYKRTYGLLDKDLEGRVARAIIPILNEILSEVKKALTFHNEKYKNTSPVSQVLLTGGSAKLPGIDLYFAQNIGVETAIGNPWKLLNIQKVPEELLAYAADYAVAIGLALKEYE